MTTAAEARISAHTALGRFRVDGTLGRGGMAVVYMAYDTELRRPVAVKVLADHGVEDDAFRVRFTREAQSAARLSHPNIVQVFDIGEDAGRPFIVMEYVEGETLADVLKRERRLAPERVTAIARQTCAGLACAHAAGLVHRDIKPHNLLVAPAATIKIADFGIAHALDQTRLTLTGSIVGTVTDSREGSFCRAREYEPRVSSCERTLSATTSAPGSSFSRAAWKSCS